MEKSIFKTIDEIIEATDFDEPIVAQWSKIEDTGAGMDIPVRHGIRIRVEVIGRKLVISGSGFKNGYRKIKSQLESIRPEMEAALGIEASAAKKQRREVEECDGGFQDYRV